MTVKMDRVYEGADLTARALASSTADDGISGVSQHFKTFDQVNSRSSSRTLITTELASLTRDLNCSDCVTRAWIFQEAVLSRRCLYFGHYAMCLRWRGELLDETVEYHMASE